MHVAIRAPGPGPQQWAGAPSAAVDIDGSILLAYRVRSGKDFNAIARSPDGEHFETIAELPSTTMVERPALVHANGKWRIYISSATPNSKHWWIGVAEADTPEQLANAEVRPVFEGDENTAVKDPVIRFDGKRWHAWICCHLLDVPGAEDRMNTAYATSEDGLSWHWHGAVLSGRPGEWDARGARLTTFLPNGLAAYDGRATAIENWFERTGFAARHDQEWRPTNDSPRDFRYLEVLELPDGTHRAYYEARLPDESHELRTALLNDRLGPG